MPGINLMMQQALLFGKTTMVINAGSTGPGGGGGTHASTGSAVALFGVSAANQFFLYQTDKYWLQDNPWGAFNLFLGSYSSDAGSSYELQVGWMSPRNSCSTTAQCAPVKFRLRWAVPRSTNEVKAYPAVIYGGRPGYSNTFVTPGGFPRILPDDTTAADFPSGATPLCGIPVSIDSLSAGVKVNVSIAGWSKSVGGHSMGGHLSFDIWFQNSANQNHGVSAPPLTHELMIPLDYWGTPVGYGSYPNRNPAWYISDTTIQGKLWHMYYAPDFNLSWVFIVFEPDSVPVQLVGGTIELGEFVLKAKQQGFLQCLSSVSGVAIGGITTHMVDIEFGVEPADGRGDITISGYAINVV